MKQLLLMYCSVALFASCSCSKSTDKGTPVTPPVIVTPVTNDVDLWVTRSNQSMLLQKQSTVLGFTTTTNSYPDITVDSARTFQTVDGFGYTLTGGSAQLLMAMNSGTRNLLLQELFSATGTAHVSYLRISVGASDLNSTPFTYNDMPAGMTDPTLAQFSLAADSTNGTGLIPLLKEILSINSSIKIMATPWSAPTWMKSNGSFTGGSLLPAYYSNYANYLVKYLQRMTANGITIDAMTVQNEPQHGGNNPSMVMSSTEQADFVKNHLGPAFQAAGIRTKIIVWDHNCDNPGYPIAILNDAAAKPFIDGSAFHLYGGDISALSTVHNAHPDKNLYFTEQWTSGSGSFDGDFKWHIKNVIIGSMRNWSRNALEWNLANDPNFLPHTPGGCTECKGAFTIAGSSVTKNVAYYIIAQVSAFVPPGSVRVSSDGSSLPHVAFVTPAGKKVLLVLNDLSAAQTFNIKFKNKWVVTTLEAGAAGTYIW